MTDTAGASLLTRLSWRPQRFGRRNAKRIADPIVEPLWDGLRVLVALEAGAEAVLVDEHGAPVASDEGVEPVFAALPRALNAGSAVLDGYLTTRATRRSEGISVDTAQTLSSSDMLGQFLVGGIAQGAARNRLEEAQHERREPGEEPVPSPIAFVAVDLLMVDGEPVLDVPLLERKRILASVIVESHLVRLTPYVRLPIDTWILSWRAAGFHEIAYKGANSRYTAGAESDDWATATLPAR